MNDAKSSGAVIHFYQKMLDKTVLIRYTTDFIMRIFALFYKKKHRSPDNESEKIIQSIQATLFAKINEYAKNIESSDDSVIEIMFQKDDLIPIVQHHRTDFPKDMLINVFFKKTGWDEINVFRFFFVRYMEHYFRKLGKAEETKKAIANVSYIVQELLQNANEYSVGNTDYELIVKHKDNRVLISVENTTDRKHFEQLKSIISDIKSSQNLQELIIKYMLAQDKHLGLISSVFNNSIETIDYVALKDNRVRIDVSVLIY